MTEWNEQAIIIRCGQFRETDMWLKMLCRTHGIQTVFAFGGAVSKHRFCGCLDIFNKLHCRIKSSRNGRYLNLQEAALLASPHKFVRRDWRRFGIGINCLRFLEAVNIDETCADASYELLEDLETTLDTASQITIMTPKFFRWRLAALLGFTPDFAHCGKCGTRLFNSAFFNIAEGSLVCENCHPQIRKTYYDIPLSSSCAQALHTARLANPSDWSWKELDVNTQRICARIIDGFVQYHLGLEWGEGGFRHV